MRGLRVGFWIALVQAVNIRQQQQCIGANHLCHPGAKAIIVTKTDFFGCDTVVFIDHRHRPQVE